jgi:TolA-binding protein
MKNYKAASQAFTEVSKSADDPRAPDALLGLASIAVAQKDKKKARSYLVQIVEKYPQSEAAATAKKALTAN